MDEATRLLSALWIERSEGTNRPPVCHESMFQSGECRESGLFSFEAWKEGGEGRGGAGAEEEIVVERQHKKEILCSSVAAGCSLQSK